MKLLIADDERVMRQGLESLNWGGIGVRLCGTAQNGAEALTMARQKKPDIVLTDIRMPGKDGLEFAEELLRFSDESIIIFISGYNDFEYVRKALKMGAFDYILKPSSPEEIFECVGRAVDKLCEMRKEQISIAQMHQRLKQAELGLGDAAPEPLEDPAQTMPASVGKILAYLEEHHGEDLNLDGLSRIFHFNPIYINRVLKKETGHTFLDILSTIRLRHAASLLLGTDHKVSHIAELVGVSDQRYFSQIFKKTYGCTPVAYRKNGRLEGPRETGGEQ